MLQSILQAAECFYNDGFPFISIYTKLLHFTVCFSMPPIPTSSWRSRWWSSRICKGCWWSQKFSCTAQAVVLLLQVKKKLVSLDSLKRKTVRDLVMMMIGWWVENNVMAIGSQWYGSDFKMISAADWFIVISACGNSWTRFLNHVRMQNHLALRGFNHDRR